MAIETFIATLLAYLFGSISSAIIICRIFSLPDPRNQGSKNPGATNVLRFGGKKAAVLTLLGDTFKGVIPVLVGKWYGFNDLGICLITLAVFLGHLYPIFFSFKGGKGVATAFGCLTALYWPIGVGLAIIWFATAIIFRYSSLAAIISAITAPFFIWFFLNDEYAFTAAIMSTLIIFRHRKNIYQLIQGKEPKIKS